MHQCKSGVIYVAVGEKSIFEVNRSINSLKNNMPKISIAVFTDTPKKISNKVDIINNIELTGNFKLDRMRCFSQSPYDSTIYLDADTLVCADFSELFDLLVQFDFAVTHSPVSYDFLIETIPNSFQQMNCGVMLYSNNDIVKDFFDMWMKTHINLEEFNTIPGDETSFRKAIYNSKIRFAIFQPGYNFRINSPNIIFNHNDIKILHGHSLYLEKIAAKIKRLRGAGFYIPMLKNATNSCGILKIKN